MRPLLAALLLVLALTVAWPAATLGQPSYISYQGAVLKNGTVYSGPANFKFAVLDADGVTYLWSNDGTLGEPGASVALIVDQAIFSVLLGQNMPPLGHSVFAQSTNPVLRVWVNTGDGFEQLPDSPIASVPYAQVAAPDGDWKVGPGSSVTLFDPSKSVGIGTAAPASKLHVANATLGQIQVSPATPGNAARLVLNDDPTTTNGGIGLLYLGAGGGRKLHFQDMRSAPFPNLVSIDQVSGFVGIGNSIPAQALDVAGGLRVGNTANSTAGSIRWTGVDFEGHDGATWKSLTGNATGGLTLPFDGTFGGSGTAFALTHTGATGTALVVQRTGGTSGSALQVSSDRGAASFTAASGSGIVAQTTGTVGWAGYFHSSNAATNQPTVYVTTASTLAPALRVAGGDWYTVHVEDGQGLLVDGDNAQLTLLRSAGGVLNITAGTQSGNMRMVAESAAVSGAVFRATNDVAFRAGGLTTVEIKPVGFSGAGGAFALYDNQPVPERLVELVALEGAGNGAQLLLSTDGGHNTVEIDADQTDAGAFYLRTGGVGGSTTTVSVRAAADSGDLGGQIELSRPDAVRTIQLDAMDNGEGAGGGSIIVYSPSGQERVKIAGDDATGNGLVRTGVLEITGGSDIAEPFALAPTDGHHPPGSVLAIDPDHPGRLRLADTPYDARVAGVISGAGGVRPGMTLRQSGVLDEGQSVALAGRVYVRTSSENGPVRPGDMLTTSSRPGVAMKATDRALSFGAVIGKAMSALHEGEGLVLVLVSLQ